MRAASRDAAVDPRAITMVQCHATSTPHGDIAELLAVRRFLGPATRDTWVSAAKV
jgi:3-oxoacyl-[acyl-carrier-protein] synthase II